MMKGLFEYTTVKAAVVLGVIAALNELTQTVTNPTKLNLLYALVAVLTIALRAWKGEPVDASK